YLFIQAADFGDANLRKVFSKFAAEYPDPKWLNIVAYSDRHMLQCLILANTRPVRITTEDENRQRCYRLLDAPKVGYFHGRYTRSTNGEEGFQYNPNPDVDNTIAVRLKARTDEDYTGDLDLDLIKASKKGDIAKTKELLAQGADVNSKDWQGDTALILTRQVEIARVLLRHRADVDAKNAYGVTALIQAADSGQQAVVQVLIEGGAKIDLRDGYGYTALLRAAMSGHAPVVEILLRMGADPLAANDLGKTALTLARDKGHKEVIRRLEAAGIQR
ncbi:MAG TPA: ankyrin repeat domain-containing protein, partial [Blastocatellia bacterium]|nr:ankyrin repeat domain-containing protein [Blastocatellia bacterium]